MGSYYEYGKNPGDLVITDGGQIGAIETIEITKAGITYVVMSEGLKVVTGEVFTSGWEYREWVRRGINAHADLISDAYDAAKKAGVLHE